MHLWSVGINAIVSLGIIITFSDMDQLLTTQQVSQWGRLKLDAVDQPR